ncbi:MAG TPA: lipocalin family protein [Saprospiraceae bacterium]|nr:lipocalin family protein [Saprospiraceae bacterium]
MRKAIVIVSILSLAFTVFSCSEDQKEKDLIGAWTLVEWKDVTNDRLKSGEVRFVFNEGKRYEASLNGNAEKGRFWVEFQNLHTVEDGKSEKKVKILKLENDTLIMEMNRMGTIEEMVLVKE